MCKVIFIFCLKNETCGNEFCECSEFFQGSNGTFQIFVQDDGGMFDVTPFRGINEAPFLIRVKDSSKLDFERISGMMGQVYNFFY